MGATAFQRRRRILQQQLEEQAKLEKELEKLEVGSIPTNEDPENDDLLMDNDPDYEIDGQEPPELSFEDEIEKMDIEQVREELKRLGVKFGPNTGEEKLKEKLRHANE